MLIYRFEAYKEMIDFLEITDFGMLLQELASISISP
jgi:hypothetical protein